MSHSHPHGFYVRCLEDSSSSTCPPARSTVQGLSLQCCAHFGGWYTDTPDGSMCHVPRWESAPNECSTCHETPPTAEEEHPTLALESHADIAVGRIRDCLRCHHSDQRFCASSGCHDPDAFQKIIEEQTMNERFH